MREPRRSQLSSAFDDLLERNWQQFDSLQGGRGRRREGDAAASGDAARDGGWRHEIIDRQREGDEAVVTCRLIVDDTGAEIVQQGRAPLGAAGRRAGNSGGIAFSIGVSDGDEAEAFQAAADAALAACLAQI